MLYLKTLEMIRNFENFGGPFDVFYHVELPTNRNAQTSLLFCKFKIIICYIYMYLLFSADSLKKNLTAISVIVKAYPYKINMNVVYLFKNFSGSGYFVLISI